ncbi:MAG: thioredoxin [Gammaproteobacteria bacterium]|nr:MAG: thioredoxin [Gammaproteobacteria bacterium]RKZ74867.1 MAG: thioredoxin [Gammaproteobacteria bacterium]
MLQRKTTRRIQLFFFIYGILLLTMSYSDENALPGIATYSKVLSDSLKSAFIAKGQNYQPRTEHLSALNQPIFTNRLILENSPYLLQHAHNPVNWFAWGNEAFEKARLENKPVFLSIGYSTCHWCHVMERESFDNIDISRLMNEHFVCIKVDREQRPEVDDVYMTAVTMIAGRGGWPMSSFLTPEGKPFFGGTYFPPEQFTHLLKQVTQIWEQQRPKILEQANYITKLVNQVTAASGEARQLGKKAISNAVNEILARHDEFLGGFGNAPKFPQETWLLLLLEVAYHDNKEALAVALKSLDAMAQGGIYDQIGGGFHRYATDAHWLTPHFEKMLYNQAHLVRAYLIAYQLTGNIIYATVARQTLDYILREMLSPEGGFYSATDADSEGEEGLFFLWTPAQIRAALNETEAELALDLYGVTASGNFEGKNILYLPVSLEKYAKEDALLQLIEKVDIIREKLRPIRDKREPPLRDDKIITAWNGMMITTLALAGDILKDQRYFEAAQGAATFILSKLKPGRGELLRVYVHKNAAIPAHQEDYAYFAEALITLYDISYDSHWLDKAREITDGMLLHFWDKAQGGFFMNRENDIPLIARPKSPEDSAIPSGNAVAVRVLGKLAARTGIEDYRDKANATLNAFSGAIVEQPSSYAYMLLAADELLHGEVGMRQYGAHGAVKATVKLDNDDQAIWLNVELNIQDGWHINAHQPLQKNLIPTSVSLDKTAAGRYIKSISYPKPDYLQLSFQQATLALYQGTVRLRGQLIGDIPLKKEIPSSSKTNLMSIRLKFQACNDKMCLPPEELVFKIAENQLLN